MFYSCFSIVISIYSDFFFVNNDHIGFYHDGRQSLPCKSVNSFRQYLVRQMQEFPSRTVSGRCTDIHARGSYFKRILELGSGVNTGNSHLDQV